MVSKSIKAVIFTLCLLFSISFSVNAEEFSNTIQSVKVKSSGDNAVVVDVYINSTDKNIKPQLSSRKYKDDKYIIDLMQVTQKGNVSKDTSASSGLLKSKDIKVGKLPGGTARVLINLDDPKVEVKEVRYHLIGAKSGSAKIPANTSVMKSTSKKSTDKKFVNTTSVTEKPAMTPANKLKLSKAEKKQVKSNKKETVGSKQADKKLTKAPKAPEKQSSNLTHNDKTKADKKSADKLTSKSTKIAQKKDLKTSKKPELSTDVSKTISGPQIIHKTDTQHKTKPDKLKIAEKPINTTKMKEKQSVKVSKTLKKVESANVKKNEHPKTEHKALDKPAKTTKDNPKTKIVHKKTDNKKLDNEKVSLKPASIDKSLIAQVKAEHIKDKTPADKVEEPLDPGQIPVNLTEDTTEEHLKVVDVKSKEVDFLGLLLTLIGALVIVIPLIYIAIWFINLFYKGGDSIGLKTLSSMGGNNFKIISSTSLGQGKSIHLVEIKGRQLVIGCTNNSINILTEFGDFDDFVEEQREVKSSEKAQAIKRKFVKGRPPLGSFADLYKDYTTRIDEEDLEDEY